MTHALRINAVRAAFVGVSVFLAAAFLQAQAAQAAISSLNVDLGVISKTTKTSDGVYDPKTGGTLFAKYASTATGKTEGTTVLQAFTEGPKGRVKAPKAEQGLWDQDRKRSFRNVYKFSLHETASLKLDLTRLSPGVNSWDNFMNVVLEDKNGNTIFSKNVGMVDWSHTWSKLAAGEYSLVLRGNYGFMNASGDFDREMLHGYNAKFSVDSPNPGDVPLPGALILLGTALAGAGVYGRRKVAGKSKA
ncbi:VPLPA-CTERM sorting domain-containing protein [Phaeovibrio sulfidiphilus]|uniref:VPLPA-CTERM sorting domain-containing protein n=1 Tax=Phaeovibrio sulfidiphilus TaxID=1220600 RepID=A0A8J6YM67_9PROT|nr:VPLPA-CTERM sorting domain-containing protein [Phaeovibrio sulfidiphilus]MBE1237198.1 VPLPA-CTERM sorting domain-containing protein [Phaeovibrio sulfidiphilus]